MIIYIYPFWPADSRSPARAVHYWPAGEKDGIPATTTQLILKLNLNPKAIVVGQGDPSLHVLPQQVGVLGARAQAELFDGCSTNHCCHRRQVLNCSDENIPGQTTAHAA